MFTLPPLPYAENALDPVISANTLGFHHGKHHKAYVDNTNNLVKGTEFEGQSLEAIVQATAGKPDKQGLFNNAAQVWNHTFYWQCLRPGGGGAPSGRVAQLIDQGFGSFDNFKKELAQACVTQFGSGWGWVVLEGGALKIQKTANGDTPIARGGKPILTIDVWEHAYYLDYQNRRPDHVNAVIDKLLNWNFANENLSKA
jgi:Fe-Mn family superoxide dismutase